MEWTNPALLIPLLGAVMVAILGGLWTVRAARIAQVSSPYGELADRVVELEKGAREALKLQVDQAQLIAKLQSNDRRKGREIIYLRDEVFALASYAREVQGWFAGGMTGSRPIISQRAEAVLARLAQDDGGILRELDRDVQGRLRKLDPYDEGTGRGENSD